MRSTGCVNESVYSRTSGARCAYKRLFLVGALKEHLIAMRYFVALSILLLTGCASTGNVPPSGTQFSLDGCTPFLNCVSSTSTVGLYCGAYPFSRTSRSFFLGAYQSYSDGIAWRFAQQCSIWICGHHLPQRFVRFPRLFRTVS